MSPDEFRIEQVYRYEVMSRVAHWAWQGGIRLNVSTDKMTKLTMASVVTQLEKEAEFFKLAGVHRPGEKIGPTQFKSVDRRAERIPEIPVSVRSFVREGKKFEGLSGSPPDLVKWKRYWAKKRAEDEEKKDA